MPGLAVDGDDVQNPVDTIRRVSERHVVGATTRVNEDGHVGVGGLHVELIRSTAQRYGRRFKRVIVCDAHGHPQPGHRGAGDDAVSRGTAVTRIDDVQHIRGAAFPVNIDRAIQPCDQITRIAKIKDVVTAASFEIQCDTARCSLNVEDVCTRVSTSRVVAVQVDCGKRLEHSIAWIGGVKTGQCDDLRTGSAGYVERVVSSESELFVGRVTIKDVPAIA